MAHFLNIYIVPNDDVSRKDVEIVLNKAKRRVGVVVNKDGDIKTWALPVTPEGVEAA